MFLQKIDKSTDFRETLLQFSTDDIKKMIDEHSIFSRGNSYYKRDYVLDVKQTKENLVKAKVSGSYDNSYDVDIYREGDALLAKCDCPYGDICKHIVATFLQISKTKTVEVSMLISNKDTLLNHLKSLSNVQLIELVMEFATESFVKEITLKDTPVEELSIRLNEIANAIERDINDENLLYNPEKFQKNISEYMENLKPFVIKNCDDVFEIIFGLASEIECKQGDGYLFIDDYYDESYFDFDTFTSEIMELITKIDNSQKQVEVFVDFAELCNGSGYMSVRYEALEIKDKRVLLSYFNNESSLAFYYFIEELLSFEEREEFLLNYSPNQVYDLVVNLYLERDRKDLAVAYVEKLIREKFDLDYIKKLLSIADISKERLRGFVLQSIEERGYRNLDFILENISKIEGRDEIEERLKDKSLDSYYTLLQQENRVAEMFELLGKLPHHKEKFLKKYKKEYLHEAITFFKAEIEKNLKSTGDEYYHKIAEYLTHLKELIDEEAFTFMVTGLKLEYKRRRNFVAILKKRF